MWAFSADQMWWPARVTRVIASKQTTTDAGGSATSHENIEDKCVVKFFGEVKNTPVKKRGKGAIAAKPTKSAAWKKSISGMLGVKFYSSFRSFQDPRHRDINKERIEELGSHRVLDGNDEAIQDARQYCIDEAWDDPDEILGRPSTIRKGFYKRQTSGRPSEQEPQTK